MAAPKLLFLGTPEDTSYTPMIKQMVQDCTVYVKYDDVSTLYEITSYCTKRGITGVFTTNTNILNKLVNGLASSTGDSKLKPSVSNYAGSYFKHSGIEYVIIEPLALLIGVPYQKFLTRRYLSKLTSPESWNHVPSFSFKILTPENAVEMFEVFSKAILIGVDIETLREDLRIRCIGYTAAIISNGQLTTISIVLPLESDYSLALMRKFNYELRAPKVLQNGKYDILYLARYNAPLYNYQYDTVVMMHCWYSELPKDLAALTAFFVRQSVYWKDLAKTNDLYEYYKYNALDTYGTVLVAMEWLLQAPDWAKSNYLQEFPLTFPCHMCELTGIKRDAIRLKRAASVCESIIAKDNISLSKMLGTYPSIFNVNSAPQNKAVRAILGVPHLTSSDETHLKKIGSMHPLNKRITDKMLDIRGDRKLISTYLTEKELNGRILYSLNPHGTDTGRLASRESAFWCGLQVQNIPRGKEVKATLIADKGFRLVECDSSQAETRDTAYISGDESLIRAVTGYRDFHSLNASAFFGVPYESIYDDAGHKTINKKLRDLAKRVNHGANYLMGEQVLLDTMGDEAVWEAKRLLALPSSFGLLDTCRYLLAQFHRTYPTLSKQYYPAVVSQIVTSKMLVGATGWTRYCFSDPVKNKRDKNSYVAHVSQSANAMRLNKAFMSVFYTIAINSTYAPHFKLLAQIHDSILFQIRVGHEYLIELVRKCMEIELEVKSYDGKVRKYTVPADVKAGKDGKGVYRWSQTE